MDNTAAEVDDVNASVREAFEALENGATPPEDVDISSVGEKEPDFKEEIEESSRARDDSGRFTKKDNKPSPPPAPDDKNKQDATLEAQATQQPARKAPSSWKPAAQEAFLKADRGEALSPQEIKLLTEEAERRESDFFKGIETFKSHAERARAYDQAIAPYQQELQRMGMDAPQAVSRLLEADKVLRNADPQTKAVMFRKMAQEYGVDLGQEITHTDIDRYELYQQQLNLQRQQQEWQNSIKQREQADALQEIERFKAKAPHLDAVRDEMALLLESGKAKSLEEAYEHAIWLNPGIRQTLIDQSKAEQLKQTQADRAKAAQVSVRGGSPSGGDVSKPKQFDDVYDAVRAAFEQLEE